MAVIVSDSFDRANDPTGLGTADTGQVWSLVSGPAGAFGINSNQALWTWDTPEAYGAVVVDSEFEDAITKVTLVNPTDGPQNFAVGMGIIFRRVDASFFWRLVYYKFPGPSNRLRLQRTYSGSTATVEDVAVTLSDGDTISVAYCDTDFEVFINDVSQGTFDDSPYPHNYGTQCGLIGTSGTYFTTLTKRFDNFLVTTNGTCTPTYNCTGAGCVDPGDGTGTYATLAACLVGCAVAESYNCVDGVCTDPGDGSGTYATLLECQNSGCGIVPAGGISTTRFDEGIGNSYYVVPQLTDSDVELRAKVVKAVRVTGKLTDADAKVYTYGPEQVVDVDDLEAGTNSITGAIALTDTDLVTTSERTQVNCPNASLHTVRVAGAWDATEGDAKDRIDEITIEQAIQDARR